MNQNKKIGIGIALTLGVVSTIWAGFDQTYGYVTRCEVRASNYVEAEYSKTDTYPCTDINGNSGLCTDTDYWDEPASDVFEVLIIPIPFSNLLRCKTQSLISSERKDLSSSFVIKC